MDAQSPATVQVACPKCLAANRIDAARLADGPKCGGCGTALLAAAPLELGAKEFADYVGRTELPVVVDFWAEWCGPCRLMAPAFAQAAKALATRARFVKVDVDEAQALAGQFGIRSIPTLVLFKDGREVDRMTGARDAGALERWVESRA